MLYDLESIAKQFQLDSTVRNTKPFGSGHINDTFLLSTQGSGYVLQRINHNVFKKPEEVMDNIVRVTEHIANKLEIQGVDDISRRVLKVIPVTDGQSYHKDDCGNYWRVFNFIENASTYDCAQSLDQACQAGRAFGQFQNHLADLQGPPLYETIPDFHNGPKRFKAFTLALEKDCRSRASKAKKEIDFMLGHNWIFNTVAELTEQGSLPIRVTHNDTKMNNIMFDDTTGEGLCVIDLDTVMPGLSLYDFGDIVRTMISDVEEDETDLSKIAIDLPRFEAIVRGYISTAGEFLNETECQNLFLAGMMMTLIHGTRFLTDYLEGDTYYKIQRPSHNLDRCRVQFNLIEQMLGHEDQMKAITAKYSSKISRN